MKIVIISPFVKKDSDSIKFSALGSYTKKLVEVLPKENQYYILCQKSINSYSYKNVKVTPTWGRGSLLFVFQILRQVLIVKPKYIFLQHEVYAFGKNQYIFPYLTILLLFFLRILGKKTIVSIHGVLPLKMLESNFIKESGVINLTSIVKLGTFVMYYFTAFFSTKVIVHNKKLKEYLVNDYKVSRDKIVVIPHPLYTYSKPQLESKVFKKITKGYKYIFLYFGFLSMYKSLDLLIEGFKKANLGKHKACLLIAGSIPKRLKNDTKYKQYIKRYKSSTKGYSIIWDTRFINDNELKTYFTRSSALILPYKYLVSASGPLTFAINSNLCVLASKSFNDVIQDDLIFGSSSTDLAKYIESFLQSSIKREKNKKAILRQKSLWSDNTLKKYYSSLFSAL